MEAEDQGGRVFFSSEGRRLVEEDEIKLLSVGVDIGSSTSHLVFSKIVLERLDSRYVVATREAIYKSDILLTPYAADETIDADALGSFIARQYAQAGIDPDQIDTGALILTGVAVRRGNARKIGEIFADQAGKLVAVSAGDSLETIMAAYGSGAVGRSIRDASTVMNVDIGGGTSKIAVCVKGAIVDRTAIDVGARLVCFDDQGVVFRTEEAGRQFAAELGIDVTLGACITPDQAAALAVRMADRLFEAMSGGDDPAMLRLSRLDPLVWRGTIDEVTISGGVSEYLYGEASETFGDLGPLLAREIRRKVESWGPRLETPSERIRATVIGASQYTTQISGGTIFVAPLDVLPLRNVPVIAPEFDLSGQVLEASVIAGQVRETLVRLELDQGDQPVAVFVRWLGSASFHRLDAFCRGVLEGLAPVLTHDRPVILAGDGDVGGLMGIHFREEMQSVHPVVSIDGLDLKAFDYIDIGRLIDSSGAVPVVIKSLIFPATSALGRDFEAA